MTLAPLRVPAAACVVALAIAWPAVSQTCDTLIGGTSCGTRPAASPAVPPGGSTGGLGFSTQSLARDLSPRSEQPGMFGAITFGGAAGRWCSGPFRVRAC